MIISCPKCGVKFDPKGKWGPRKFCGRQCANSRDFSASSRRKKSDSLLRWTRLHPKPKKQYVPHPRELKDRILSGDGRMMIRAPEGYAGKKYIGGRYIYEHRYVMEMKLGRLLRPGEIVHHINHDKTDNRKENLVVMTAREHAIHHGRKFHSGVA
jgi:hypothetical protein